MESHFAKLILPSNSIIKMKDDMATYKMGMFFVNIVTLCMCHYNWCCGWCFLMNWVHDWTCLIKSHRERHECVFPCAPLHSTIHHCWYHKLQPMSMASYCLSPLLLVVSFQSRGPLMVSLSLSRHILTSTKETNETCIFIYIYLFGQLFTPRRTCMPLGTKLLGGQHLVHGCAYVH